MHVDLDVSGQSASSTAGASVRQLAVWLARHPLVVCLPVQAALLFADLARLPIWGDEHASLSRAALSVRELSTALQGNVHPLLYFLLLRGWLALPWGADAVVGARALSALCVVMSTWLVDRLWARRLDTASRCWFLALWGLSPALLLYGRMARSYALQLLLACLVLHAGERYAARTSWSRLVAYAAAAVVLLHTHYLPAIAVVTSVTLVMLSQAIRLRHRRSLLAVLAPLAVIGAALAAWMGPFAGAVERVAGATPYRMFGSWWLDVAAALGYTAISFTSGESLSTWMIPTVLAVMPAVGVLVIRGVCTRPDWLRFVLPAAVVGFVGAKQWVSYAFVPARLLFLLPFYVLLVVLGGRAWPRIRAVVCGALLCLSLGATAAYFQQRGFLNKAYVIPVAEMSRVIRERSGAAPFAVIIDHPSTDLLGLAHDLGAGTRTTLLTDHTSVTEAIRLAASGVSDLVWFVRSAHDGSHDHMNQRVEDAFTPAFTIRRTGFVAYAPLDRWMMEVAGWSERPTHAIEVLEMRRRGRGG